MNKTEQKTNKTEQKTVEVLEQFDKDLEAGDLSEYRITKLITCPDCNGTGGLRNRVDVSAIIECWHCNAGGLIKIVVQEGLP